MRAELGDEDVLELTCWAWKRVVVGLGGSPTQKSPSLDTRQEVGDEGGPEVTVGIVRG